MTVKEFIRGLAIMTPYFNKGEDTGCFCGAEHDIIYFYVDDEKIPEDSTEGKELDELGFHLDSDVGSWATFV